MSLGTSSFFAIISCFLAVPPRFRLLLLCGLDEPADRCGNEPGPSGLVLRLFSSLCQIVMLGRTVLNQSICHAISIEVYYS